MQASRVFLDNRDKKKLKNQNVIVNRILADIQRGAK